MTGAPWERTPNRRRFNVHFTVLCATAAVALAMPLAATAQAIGGPASGAARTTSSADAHRESRVLVVGDSLSAEYGLARGSGWVSLLQKQLAQQKVPVPLVNGSISGETTSGGRSRLPALLKQHQPTLVVIELGGNDGLRGLPLATTQANLQAMAQMAKAAGAQVLLVGMQVPPNYGRQYSDDFAQLFGTVAKAERATLVPFLLKGVADAGESASLFQADRIHPNEKAQSLMLDNVWPVLKTLL